MGKKEEEERIIGFIVLTFVALYHWPVTYFYIFIASLPLFTAEIISLKFST
jgi:hypothetical protein